MAPVTKIVDTKDVKADVSRRVVAKDGPMCEPAQGLKPGQTVDLSGKTIGIEPMSGPAKLVDEGMVFEGRKAAEEEHARLTKAGDHDRAAKIASDGRLGADVVAGSNVRAALKGWTSLDVLTDVML